MYDLIVKNARMVGENSIVDGSIAVKDGRFAAFLAPDAAVEAAEVIDAAGNYVFPGLIDCHVHFEDPGFTWREDFETGSRAAAVGGLTTVVEMPLDNEPTPYNLEGFQAKRDAIAGKAYIDYALWGALCGSRMEEMKALTEQGVGAFKSFTIPVSGMVPPPFPGATPGEIRQALELMKGTNALCGFHCEEHSQFTSREKMFKDRGDNTPRAFTSAHDVWVEYVAVQDVIAMARATGGKAHICHVSHPLVAQLVKNAINDGVDISAETCAHYLGFDESIFDEKGVLAKGTPPIRDAEAKEALWDYVLDGTLSCICSDHSPADVAEKEGKNIWEAWGGMNSIQVFVSRMFDLIVTQRGLSPTLLTKTMCANPARRFGLYGRKGGFELGFDADMVILDPEKKWTMTKEQLVTKHQVSVYDGISGVGAPVRTIVRGRTVAADGKYLDAKGFGQYVPAK